MIQISSKDRRRGDEVSQQLGGKQRILPSSSVVLFRPSALRSASEYPEILSQTHSDTVLNLGISWPTQTDT